VFKCRHHTKLQGRIYYYYYYFTMLSVSAPYSCELYEDRTIFRRKLTCSNRCTILAFPWKGSGKPQKPSVGIIGVPIGIRTECHPNTSRERFHYRNIILYTLVQLVKKGKAIPVSDCEGPWGCETSRLPHFLDNRLTNGGEVVSLTHSAAPYHQEDSWCSFLLEAESLPGP
jgi:hypothetical protein